MVGKKLALTLGLIALLYASQGKPETGPRPRWFDSQRAYRDLVLQCDFGPRVPGTEAHDRCAQWLVEELRASTEAVSQQSFSHTVRGRDLNLTNIIAVFNARGKAGGRESQQALPGILLCAHWDTRPTAERDPDPAKRADPVSGANDGASGVAVLLELARALKANPTARQVTLVLFDGEDYGPAASAMFLGSRYFADHYLGPPIAWAVLVDMVGDRDLQIKQEKISVTLAPQVVERIWGAAARAGCSGFAKDRGPAVLDDHVPLLQRGIPCVNLIDHDYLYWHTTEDTPDKCSAASLDQVGRVLLQAIEEHENSRELSHPSEPQE